jgi:hypothetical protein
MTIITIGNIPLQVLKGIRMNLLETYALHTVRYKNKHSDKGLYLYLGIVKTIKLWVIYSSPFGKNSSAPSLLLAGKSAAVVARYANACR